MRAVLTARCACLVWVDRGGRPVTPLWRTTDWGYLRLHRGADGWDYGPVGVAPWAARLAETWSPEEDSFVYTNNDPTGAALRDAVHLAAALRSLGREPSRVPVLSDLLR